MTVVNNNALVTWSEVLIAAADDSEHGGKEVRHPAMLHLARGKGGGEPTAAYEEDPTGITAKVHAQLAGGKHALEPPTSDPTFLKRRRKTKAEKRATKAAVTASAGRESAQVRVRVGQDGGHPKQLNGKYITSREGIEICFTFAKNGRDSCPDPCRNKRVHICQICLGGHRNEECSRANNLDKGAGKGGKGK